MNRDHRELGQQLDLFMFSPLSPGCPIWLPQGNTVYSLLSQKIREYNLSEDYVEVRTPVLWKTDLYKQSGHWDHYKENMFLVGEEQALKPMNCPGHMVIFKSKSWSYRDLPYRIHDQGVLHRNESSGSIGGLTRCRSFCQDDAHCFVKPEDVHAEMCKLIEMILNVYTAFQMPVYAVLSTRPKDFMGNVETWDEAEQALNKSLLASGLTYKTNEGDGAFYGPKIDFIVTDSLGREWQTATIQLDFQLPERFALEYVGEDNSPHQPIVIHRAMYGSFERFIGILLEHYDGNLPFWLAPTQAIILPIAERHNEYVKSLQLRFKDFRVETDLSNNTLSQKIAVAETKKVPYMIIVGDKEIEQGSLSVRPRGGKKNQPYTPSRLEDRFKLEDTFDFQHPAHRCEEIR